MYTLEDYKYLRNVPTGADFDKYIARFELDTPPGRAQFERHKRAILGAILGPIRAALTRAAGTSVRHLAGNTIRHTSRGLTRALNKPGAKAVVRGLTGAFLAASTIYTGYQLAQLAQGDSDPDPEITPDTLDELINGKNTTFYKAHATKLALPNGPLQRDLTSKHLNKLNGNVAFLFEHLNHVEINDLISRGQMTQMIFNERIRTFFKGLETLHLHHLSPDLVTIDQANRALDKLSESLQQEGLNLVNPNVDSVFRAEVSYIYLENGTLRILVHLPCFRDEGILTLLRYIPVPLPLSEGKTIIVKPQHTFLAVDNSGSLIQTMSSDDFGLCRKINDLITCPNQNWYDKRFEDSCIISLYHSNIQGIRRNCRLELDQEEDFVAQLNSTTFLLHLINKEKIERVCRIYKSRGSSSFKVTQGTSIIQISPGCKVITKSFMFEASEDTFSNPVDINFRIIDLKKILAGVPLDLFNFSLPHPLLNEPAHNLELEQLISSYQQTLQTNTHSSATIIYFAIALSISLLTFILIICYCLYKSKWVKRIRSVAHGIQVLYMQDNNDPPNE
jgi:hypothetical protein